MPNKDSFTFSDKLKKSKSLPLSKRIPSKLGGDGKAKRTLIQRAQRDLPFIIVAAAALLLLPILSHNSGTDDLGIETPMEFVAPDTSYSAYGGLGQEIVPSGGFKNPLDYIVSRSGKDTESRDIPEFSGDEFGGGPSTTPPYISDRGERMTDKYEQAAKGSVKHSVERKPTKIEALRNSKTMAASAKTDVSRSLATGSAASSGGGAAGPRVGTRPVALQPMASAGKGGRSETGEGLYAEAARSLGAMNRPGSKQALFDAQLKNVDGTPLGSIGGGPNFGSGAGKLGAGGAPSNNVGYKPYLPWWWDFEKQKAMKRWELWNYNFQKALSDSIVKVGTGVALCLMSGSADGKVDKFLGDKGGVDDYTCPGGNVQDWETHRDLMGKDESGSGESKESRSKGDFEAWVKLCNESNGNKGYEKTTSDRKNMLDVRLRCLGFKYKNSSLYKLLQGAEYSVDCSGVDNDPISFKFTANKERHLGHYVLAKNLNNKEAVERIIYVGASGNLDNKALQTVLTTLNSEGNNKYVVTMIKGFKANGAKMSNDNVSKAESKLQELKSYTAADIERNYSSDEYGTAQAKYNDDVTKAKNKLDQATKEAGNDGGNVSDLNYESRFTMFKNAVASSITSGKYIYDSYGEEKFKVLKDCPVSGKFLETKIDNTGLVSGNVTVDKASSSFITCVPNPAATNLNPGADYTFRASITNPGKNVFAVFVENVQYSAAGATPTDRFVVKRVVNLSAPEFKGYRGDDGTFYIDSKIGLAASTKEDKLAAAAPGTGRVYWITTNGSSEPLVDTNVADDTKPSYFSSPSISASQLVDVYGGSKMAVCEYRWGCDAKLCPSKQQEGDYCVVGNQFFPAVKADNRYIRTSITALTDKDLPTLKSIATTKGLGVQEEKCMDCFAEAFRKDYPCADICYKLEKVFLRQSDGFANDSAPVGNKENIFTLLASKGVDKSALEGGKNALCPVCNHQEQKQADCSFNAGANFDTASHIIGANSIRDRVRGTAEIPSFYNNCLLVRAQDPNKKAIDIYVTGFTSESGDGNDIVKCRPTVCDPVTGNDISKELPNSNVVLSEDRAISVAEKVVKEIYDLNNEKENTLLLAYDFQFKRNGKIESHFKKHQPRSDAEIKTLWDNLRRLSNVSGAPTTVKLNFIIKGVGSFGAAKGNKDSDRQVVVSIYPETTRIPLNKK